MAPIGAQVVTRRSASSAEAQRSGRRRKRRDLFGALRDPAGGWLGYDGRPTAVTSFLAYSLQRFGVDHIDIYRPARLDPNVPIEETVGAIAEMIQARSIRYIGLSEVGPQAIRAAAAVHPISDLQIEYSPISRGIEANILATCRQLGIGIAAHRVLSRGLISGHWKQGASSSTDFRTRNPRFDLALVEKLRKVADQKGVSVAQLAIAWVAAQGENTVPLIGARRRDRLAEALGALDVTLTREDMTTIERTVPKGAAAGAVRLSRWRALQRAARSQLTRLSTGSMRADAAIRPVSRAPRDRLRSAAAALPADSLRGG